ncbi:MAG: 2-oxoglutarate dehydrogenase E1 component [Parachlamydiales bacterium]|nr:2-oxoglutarate dehydrogenase E1 component [Parachlamydiales bacterium]
MPEFPDYAQLANLQMIEDLYSRYLANPESVDISWRHFFEGIDFGAYLTKRGVEPLPDQSNLRILELIQAYRRFGHLLARFNPLEQGEKTTPELELENLGFFSSELDQEFPTLGFCGKEVAPLREIIAALKEIYCSRIGVQFAAINNPELRKWIQSRLEPKLLIEPTLEEKHLLLEYLNKSEVFETFLHTKYVGQTRFSLEGAETMIPLIAEIVDYAGDLGVGEMVIGMAHRGRLNVLTNILNKSLEMILAEFEDDTTLSFSGNDDVRYHMGFEGEFTTRGQKKVLLEMAANPSHLESVNPVVLGQTYAKQFLKQNGQKDKIIPLLIHGDASIAGQGVIYECMQLMKLPGYSVGGTIHLVVNNQIGYTTLPEEGRSTRYCTDIAKSFGCPVFHVNAEDPESCLFAAKLAVEIRQKFHIDVFLDLYCYRKYGHNEGDEPSYTQPLQYEVIRAKKPIRQIYFEKLLSEGKSEQKLAETLEAQFKETMKKALAKAQEHIAGGVSEKPAAPVSPFEPVKTAVSESKLNSVLDLFCKIPQGFNLHPKLQKWLENRHQSLQKGVDWATGECLAFGTLLDEKISVRLAGQDSKRGTFSQRHVIWIDNKTGNPYCPLCNYSTPFQVINSPLSEYACMGFEYGYSWSAIDGLTLWEAQYGDFFNGAQIVIDQYIVSGDQKWNTPSSLTLLLPHAYEGAGPEHSSARIERFLQLCANQNIIVAYPSTPAQYFHLLRRQAIRKVKKPLVVFTPKSLLRAPACVSKAEEFTKGRFFEMLDDPTPPQKAKRLIFCSGKIFYELLAARTRSDVAILRIEQLYPLHLDMLKELIAKYAGFTECIWVQEEAENMGAWRYIGPYLQSLTKKLAYVGRPENATTATGSSKKHKQEQAALIKQAFGDL